ncbi:ribosomal protein L7/L12 C-terminal domain-containing protein [Russula compacta]|nr:ribosomal protein L7/L12 C-terminal domain-containing protein [Russula compacta]
MQSRHLSLTLRAVMRHHQCVQTHSISAHRASASVRVRALATATTPTSSSPSSASPPPPVPAAAASSSSTLPSPSQSPTTPSDDPALHRLVDDISTLTLLQAADLVTLLKTRLNIQEIAFPTAGAAAAAAPSATGAGAAGADDAAADEASSKPKEKTIFNVKLESFDAGSKPKVIKEVKAMVPNLTLIEAKKFVESLPKVLKEGIPKEDAEKIQKAFEHMAPSSSSNRCAHNTFPIPTPPLLYCCGSGTRI